MKTSRSGLAALIFVCVVWGSSFLAIRLAVSGAGAFPPFTLAAARTLVAGLLLLLVGLLKSRGRMPGASALGWLTFTGLVLWVGGHALLIWAERGIDSGLAALLYASAPLWASLFEGLMGRRVRPWPLLMGFAGVSLVLPLGTGAGSAPWLAAAAVLLSAFFWALGTVLGTGPAKDVPLAISAGVQLTAAGLATALWAVLAGEPLPSPDTHALLAWGYLTFVGTVLAYLAYAHAQRTLPVVWVMSYGYVSPIVAVGLGALVLGEKISVKGGIGIALVMVAVVWLFTAPAPSKAEGIA